VVAVIDEALACSLELTLSACGIETTGPRGSIDLSAPGPDDCELLIVDRQMLPPDLCNSIQAMRRLGWRGLIILLTEDDSDGRDLADRGPQVRVLEKPFGSAEIVTLVIPSLSLPRRTP